MNLIDLEPQFLKNTDSVTHRIVDSIEQADGIMFLCPKCFKEKGTKIGVHSIICWNPSVPQIVNPTVGRWRFIGTGYNDLTLTAGSSSIKIENGCKAHFFITNGQIRMT